MGWNGADTILSLTKPVSLKTWSYSNCRKTTGTKNNETPEPICWDLTALTVVTCCILYPNWLNYLDILSLTN